MALTWKKLKYDEVSATSRILGRKTAGAGAIEELTLSEIMDFIGSAAEGDILYRGASAWARLGKGSDGQILTLASGLPSWAAAGGGGATMVNTILGSDFNTTSSSYVDVTGQSVTLTANKKYVLIIKSLFQSNWGEANILSAILSTSGSGTKYYSFRWDSVSGSIVVVNQPPSDLLVLNGVQGNGSAFLLLNVIVGGSDCTIKWQIKNTGNDPSFCKMLTGSIITTQEYS